MTEPALKIGLMLPTHAPSDQPLDWRLVGTTAEWAEAQGFNSLWAGDHIVHPWTFMESLTTLAYVAARTRNVALGSCVLLLPMRQLSIAAAQIATIATLSEGRFRLGIGTGGEWPAEWQAAGVPLKERGARLDEALPLLRRLFDGETVNFEGRFNSFADVAVRPPPPRVPIYLAGRAPAALARVGRHGDGWLGFFVTPSGFRRDRAAIDEAREQAGRSHLPFQRGMLFHFHIDENADRALARAAELNFGMAQQLQLEGSREQLQRFAVAGSPDAVLARLQDYAAAGCDLMILAPMAKTNEAYQEQVRSFASEVLPRLKPATSARDGPA